MKKPAVVLLAAAILVSGAVVYAAGESLISKSYLSNTYIPDVEKQVKYLTQRNARL